MAKERIITVNALDAAWQRLAEQHAPKVVPGAKTGAQCAVLFGCSETKWRDREAKRLEDLGVIERIERVRFSRNVGTGWVLRTKGRS